MEKTVPVNVWIKTYKFNTSEREVKILSQPFNRLATHFNISVFGHQTMFDDVWSPNISRLDRP